MHYLDSLFRTIASKNGCSWELYCKVNLMSLCKLFKMQWNTFNSSSVLVHGMKQSFSIFENVIKISVIFGFNNTI